MRLLSTGLTISRGKKLGVESCRCLDRDVPGTPLRHKSKEKFLLKNCPYTRTKYLLKFYPKIRFVSEQVENPQGGKDRLSAVNRLLER